MPSNEPSDFPSRTSASPVGDETDPFASIFPSPEDAAPDGLLAVGGALTPDLIVAALVRGIFPWTLPLESPFKSADSDGGSDVFSALTPRCRNANWNGVDAASLATLADSGEILTWQSPDPRAIFELDEFHVSRRLERTIRNGKFRVTFDEAFPETMIGCAKAKARATTEGTWITREFYAGYCRLFEIGLAHSAECWLDDRLVGGVYGVALNGFFDGESMFSVERDASKIALTSLIRRLRKRGFRLFDLQILNPFTESLGGKEISRSDYLRRLDAALRTPVKFDDAPSLEFSGNAAS